VSAHEGTRMKRFVLVQRVMLVHVCIATKGVAEELKCYSLLNVLCCAALLAHMRCAHKCTTVYIYIYIYMYIYVYVYINI